MGIRTGSGGSGGSRRTSRVPRRLVQGQAQKPFRPIESPFPSKGEFRFGTYRIIEEKDDYLICEGYDPRAKNPFSEITPDAPRTIKVAKPPLLQKTPWDGEDVVIKGTTYSYEYDASEVGTRTVTWTNEADEEMEEEQKIDTPYFEDDILVAVQVSKNSLQDGMVVNEVKVADEQGTLLSWVDLNVSGRSWEIPSDNCPYYHQFVIFGGSALPTSGSQIFGYTIDGDTQDVTVNYDMTVAELKSEFLTQFSALTSVDIEVGDGAWPLTVLELRFVGNVADYVAAGSPPTVGTNTLNNNCWAGIIPVPSWGG